MKKRILPLLLAIALLLPCLPVQPARAEITTQEDLESIIAQQYDAYVKSLNAEGASEGVSQLIRHSVKGGGDLHMDENDKFTKAMLSSGLMRENFIKTTAAAFGYMQFNQFDKLFLRGGLSWYEHKLSYQSSAWADNENGNDKDDERLQPYWSISQTEAAGPFNTYDEGMMLVGGATQSRITIRLLAVTQEEYVYSITVLARDAFDFSTTHYEGENTELASTLSWMGRLLALGLLTTFDWTAQAELQIRVPNTCTHESGNYRWEFDGKADLVNMVSGENLSNSLQKMGGNYTDGVFEKTYYRTSVPIRLYHNRPWVLEYKCKGKGYFAFAPNQTSRVGEVYLRKYHYTVYFGVYEYLEDGITTTLWDYGVQLLGENKVNYLDEHVYRLENRVFEDGSNMVYLFVDGNEISPMNNLYEVKSTNTNVAIPMGTSDWLSGKDFLFNYVGNRSLPFHNISVDYIQIWENGIDAAPFKYYVEQSIPTTCTENGGTAEICTLCNAVVSLKDVKPAFGHSFGPWELVREAVCDREGQEQRVCSTCGEAETRQLPKPDHVFPEEWTLSKEATCKAEGEERKACRNCGEEQTRKLPKVDHNYIPEVVAPTCYSQGYTRHTCPWCGDSYKDNQVNALGHKPGTFISDGNVTCTKDGTMSADCARCDMRLTITEEATGHKYEKGTCTVCGEKDETYGPEAFTLYGSSMTLGNALDMNFFVDQSDIEDTGNYAIITKHYADDREDAVVRVEQEKWKALGSKYYYFTFSGVRAKEMADKVDVVIYNAEGEAISEVFTDSVQNYARRMLDNPETSAKDKRLYIEMLNYGAAAQAEFEYNMDHSANSVITAEEQAQYGMESRTYTDLRQRDDAYYGTTLTLENQIVFNIFYNGSYVPEGAYAVATFTNHKGEAIEEKVTSFEKLADYQYASFKSLVVADCSEPITVTLYDGEGNTISTVTDSIEGYAARMTKAAPLYDAIMKFADAAYQYFHS